MEVGGGGGCGGTERIEPLAKGRASESNCRKEEGGGGRIGRGRKRSGLPSRAGRRV